MAGKDVLSGTGHTVSVCSASKKKQAYIEHIELWHGDHNSSHPDYSDCKIYVAIQTDLSDDELIGIAEEEDDGIKESFEEEWKEMEAFQVMC